MKDAIVIDMKKRFGSFLANGTLAAAFCINDIIPNLKAGKNIIIDMNGIENMTDSFGNAFIANMVKSNGDLFFKQVKFANCTDTMKVLVSLAVRFGKILQSEAGNSLIHV